jgi:WD40 repeat protein
VTINFGQDFEFIHDPTITRGDKPLADSFTDIIDARTDERWVRMVEGLVARHELEELWNLAQKAPPIWTIRILKFLKKQSWQPESELQLDFFNQLNEFAAACNDYDLPGPKSRSPQTSNLLSVQGEAARNAKLERSAANGSRSRITAARVTADGEFIFVLNDKCTAFEVRKVSDFTPAARIRIDLINGKQYVLLAFDVARYGDKLAVLLFEPKTNESIILIYEFWEGDLIGEKQFKISTQEFGLYVPKLAFTGSSEELALSAGPRTVTIWNAETGQKVRDFEKENVASTVPPQYQVQAKASYQEWHKYGRWALLEQKDNQLKLSQNSWQIAEKDGDSIAVWTGPSGESNAWSSAHIQANGPYDLALDERKLISVNKGAIDCYLPSLKTTICIAVCNDPTLKIAISPDSEILVASMSHGKVVMLWHLPDGRKLGTLNGLAKDYLVDLKMTFGGSIIAITRSGLVQTWESDGNGNAWPWSQELVQITHQPVDSSSVKVLRQAQEMRRRGWLSVQESNLLNLALALMQNRLNLDIEIEWDSTLPGDVFDIEID